MPDCVVVTNHGPIREVTMNRPRNLNALNLELMSELADAMTAAAVDPSVRGVLFSGRGRAFCAGGDLKWALDYASDPGISLHVLAGQLNRLAVQIRSMPKPVVAAVQGAAAGAGFMLALACDFRIMEQSAFFQQAYTSNGLCIDGGGTFSLPRLVGLARAMEIAAFDERISAPKALEWGLATRLVPDGTAHEEALKMLQDLARRSLHAFRCTKELLNGSFQRSFEEQAEWERRSLVACARHADGREGLQAFVEKRPPQFI
ncbi:enoyl-CoA hydratase/isomerase family protein [Desulfosoma caldarium]|uniref:2-(1,2-epoxy-1,2-dihydrophenyl)acetyl-CoA isomerase n=1 Tax=Desulfosoma caldarium TaxID=610254 RepID=A0A3N1UUE2_9BACT|nr:enoyl-CoA hydratase-related protein [Desulfosoma caldarium]ROQ92157.1 2-(1,2-epoxy-1,2-dihydrophenyl)acetyl-CoA isomerase [Desulfosoma caldarium]